MTPSHDEDLCRRFPRLYADRHGDPSKTIMCYGFACGDGWYRVVERLSMGLEALINQLPENARDSIRAVQVKQKFGGLRFYLTQSSTEMNELIRQAERESQSTCEECGANGEIRNSNGWDYVACKSHARDGEW